MKKCSIILLKFNILFFFLNTFAKDGDLDPTFGTGGLVITDFASSDDFGNSIAIQPDGKIIVAGFIATGPNPANFALARYTATGILDSGFGSGGLVITDFGANDAGNSVAIQADGKIIVAGFTTAGPNAIDFALARYTSIGTLDIRFLS